MTPWWKLGLTLTGVIGLLAVMDEAPGWVAVGALTMALAALGVAGTLWGRDSLECGDWSPNGRSRALRG